MNDSAGATVPREPAQHDADDDRRQPDLHAAAHGERPHARGVGATSQPMATPMRNGAATPRIEAMPLPSSCELRPRTTNTSTGGDVRADGDEALLHDDRLAATCTVTTAL